MKYKLVATRLLHCFHGLLPVAGENREMAEFLQEPQNDLLVDNIVLRQQDPQ